MIGPAKIYFIIFGILTIAGGIIGYVKAGSTVSIIAGSISGLLLLLAAWLMPEHQAAGLIVALVVSLLLAAQFITLPRSEEHTSELQSHVNLVCRLLLEKKKTALTSVYAN